MSEIVLESPLDMHLHLRDGDMLKRVAKYSGRSFCGGVIMPNLNPPVDSAKKLIKYRDEINELLKDEIFTPYMALFFRDDLSERDIRDAKDEGALIVKLYPKGSTTNSEDGSSEILSKKNRRVFEMISEAGLKLSIHGESGGFVLDRESEFLPIYEEIAKSFPKLGVVIEHMSSKNALDSLDRYENLSATITLHHIELTLDDLIGGSLNPHHFCKPIVKTPKDKEALLEAALSAHPKVCFGSDSAPHLREKKESQSGAAGIFSAPIALPYLAHIFHKHSSLHNLQKFVSNNAREIYKITPPKKIVKLIYDSMTIKSEYEGIVPMRALEKIDFREL